MTILERIKKAVNLEKQDRVPVMPQITYTTHQLTGATMIDIMNDPEKMAEALVAGFREIGYDGIYSGWESSFNIMAEALGCIMKYPEGDVPSVAKGIVKKVEDLDKIIPPDPWTSPKLLLHLKTLKLIREAVGPDVPIFNYIPGPLTVAGLLMNTDRLMINLIKNPDLVHKTCRITTEAAKLYISAKLEAGGNIMVVAEPTASSSVIAPKMFEAFAFPYLKELFNYISDKGGIPSLHICGNTNPILEKIAETGAKIVELDHMVNLCDAVKRIGDKVCIQGNVDPSRVMLLGKPDEVYKVSRQCMADASEAKGFILSTGCEVPLKASIENVKAMVKAAMDKVE